MSRRITSAARRFRPLLLSVLHGETRAIAGLVLAAGLASAFGQAGCDGSRSPTAPPPAPHQPQEPAPAPQPPPQPPPPSPPQSADVFSVNFFVSIWPVDPTRENPRAGQLFINGTLAFDDRFHAWNGNFYPYNNTAVWLSARRESMRKGRHTLSLRVTDQRTSPTEYYVSGRVDVWWSIGGSTRVASWEDVQVRLRTNEDWSLEFIIPKGPPA